ncbi:protein yellow-like [Babylonia areolata]|uniref:protein yellow-like n=1 Tax=Babylonia areolata TaxID=304850 RepID=UPI003FD09F66
MAQLVTSLLVMAVTCAQGANSPPASLVYSWVSVQYDWPSDTVRQQYVSHGKYIVKNNIITGVKVYNDEVYVTVPRWRPGVPSTLNRVVMKNGSAVLQPYPSWQYQTLVDCSALQYVQSMEVDPNTGLMWIIDNGRINFNSQTGPPSNLCPPKLVIYDIEKEKQVHSYTFPDHVANHSSCFLNDIVLHYVSGDVRFAYITDTRDAKLYVYDYASDTSHFFQHSSMLPETSDGIPIDGIALSADFQYLYYCPITGLGLFQVPTSVLADPNAPFGKHVRRVGTRLSRSDGLAYGQRSLFYGMLDKNGVECWHIATDAEDEGYGNVTMTTQEELMQDDVRMRWVDTFGWDQSGHLWFTANDLTSYFNGSMDFTGASGPNMYVWKVFVNESSYLTNVSGPTSGTCKLAASASWAAGTVLVLFVLKRLSWM